MMAMGISRERLSVSASLGGVRGRSGVHPVCDQRSELSKDTEIEPLASENKSKQPKKTLEEESNLVETRIKMIFRDLMSPSTSRRSTTDRELKLFHRASPDKSDKPSLSAVVLPLYPYIGYCSPTVAIRVPVHVHSLSPSRASLGKDILHESSPDLPHHAITGFHGL
jgi:hypothetical protein